MNGYAVLIPKKFWKVVGKQIPTKYHSVIKKKLIYLKENPLHPSLNTKPYSCSRKMKKKLKNEGVDEIWEFYINKKKYRCVFYVLHEKKEIIVAYAGLHEQVAKKYARK